MTTTEKLRQAQRRVADQRNQAHAARLAGAARESRTSPSQSLPPTPHDERPAALAIAPPSGKVLLSRADLRELGVDYHRASLRRLMSKGKFPKPVAAGPEPYARKFWRADDIKKWLADLAYISPQDAA